MKHGSLFSGMGGFDLAAQWMGWENIFHCEWNDFGQRILKYYWPNAISYNDIKQTDFTRHRGTIDILTGGFPCQPYSQAGKRKGKADDRHLWPEMLRAIRQIQPSWVVGENVRGLINWNGGLVFHEVQADLEAEGYEVFPYLLPAAGVNAPHERYRIWFVAHSRHYSERAARNRTTNEGSEPSTLYQARQGRESTPIFNSGYGDIQGTTTNTESHGDRGKLRGMENQNGSIWEPEKHGKINTELRHDGGEWLTTHTQNERRNSGCRSEADLHKRKADKPKQKRNEVWTGAEPIGTRGIITDTNGIRSGENDRQVKSGLSDQFGQRGNWSDWPTKSPICTGNDGLSFGLDTITVPSKRSGTRLLKGKQAFGYWRKESIKAGGNAIVPQVVFEIFKAIEQYELLKTA